MIMKVILIITVIIKTFTLKGVIILLTSFNDTRNLQTKFLFSLRIFNCMGDYSKRKPSWVSLRVPMEKVG